MEFTFSIHKNSDLCFLVVHFGCQLHYEVIAEIKFMIKQTCGYIKDEVELIVIDLSELKMKRKSIRKLENY